ncbi:MAG: hypothetical protein RIR11_5177 [Bacteroidota bacterium]|jgi:hypothetical protein
MNRSQHFLLILLCATLLQKVNAQKILNHSEIRFGTAWALQDRRLFETNPKLVAYILEREDQEYDFQYSLSWQKRWLQFGQFGLKTGINYSVSNTKFGRTYNPIYQRGDNEWPAAINYRIGKYSKKLLQAPIDLQFYLLQMSSNKANVYLNFGVLPSICFNKRIRDSRKIDGEKSAVVKHRNLWFDGVEFNPGIGFKFGRFDVLVSHRLYNFTKKDGLIFYYDLFYKGFDAPFLLDRYEWFNPKKYWITIGYQIRQ